MKLKIFRANQIVMGISLLTFLLTNKDNILHMTADYLLTGTLFIMFWFIVDATSNFLELEKQINEEIKNDETSE
jgi:heme A synthase